MNEPTAEQCGNHDVMRVAGVVFVAAWYPQMGGYGSRCWVELNTHQQKDDGFDAYVWHDGEFPFTGDNGRSPSRIHHCSAQQFIDFGKMVQEFAQKESKT